MASEQTVEQFFLRDGGKQFWCECGCNVFHARPPHEGKKVYACNACKAEYTGDTPSEAPDGK